MPDPSLTYATTQPPVVRGGPPSWGPFAVAAGGVVVAGVLLGLVLAGTVPMTMRTVPFIIVPAMIVAFTAAMASMGWMFLLFGRFGRRTRWLWPSGILIVVIVLELFAITYQAGMADQALATGGAN